MKRKSRNRLIKLQKRDIPFIIFFILGVMLVMYPFVSEWINKYQYHNINKAFDNGAEKLSKQDIEKRYKLARYYNDALIHPNIVDPYTRKNHERGIKEYARMLQIKESMGYVEIPKIGQSLPIYAGTSEDILQIGVGHLEFTSLPIGGKGNHCVLTAHSGLPKARLFTDIRKLKEGDIFFIHNIKEVIAYEVDDISVILPTDFSRLKRVPGKDYCTLMTCTPYMINTHRLLVRGKRVPYKKALSKKYENKLIYYMKKILVIILIILIFRFIKKRIKRYIEGK